MSMNNMIKHIMNYDLETISNYSVTKYNTYSKMCNNQPRITKLDYKFQKHQNIVMIEENSLLNARMEKGHKQKSSIPKEKRNQIIQYRIKHTNQYP